MPAPSQYAKLTIFEDKKHVRRLVGLGLMHDLLRVNANVDTIFIYDDFLREAIDQTNGFWIEKVSTGTAEIAPDVAGGVLRLTTGAGDNAYVGAAGQLSFNTSLNPVLVTSIKSNAVTALKVEVGWTDAQNDAGAVNDADATTPTSTASDYAVGIVDTDANTNSDLWMFATDGSTANMNATMTASGFAFGAAPATITTAAADTYDKMAVTIRAISATVSTAQLYRNGALLAQHGGALASQIKGAIAIAPWLFGQSRSTTSRLVDVDFAILMQDRA